MRDRAAFMLMLFTLTAALGTGVAFAQSRSSDDTPVTVRAYGGLARRGFPVYLSFRVQAPGSVSVRLTMRLKTHVAVSGTVKLVAPRFETRQVWKGKVRRAVPAGRYRFCAVASDGFGHRATRCAFYRVV